jgi:hypothetical protein
VRLDHLLSKEYLSTVHHSFECAGETFPVGALVVDSFCNGCRDSVPPIATRHRFVFSSVLRESSLLRRFPQALAEEGNAQSHLENCRASTSIFVLLNNLYSKQ